MRATSSSSFSVPSLPCRRSFGAPMAIVLVVLVALLAAATPGRGFTVTRFPHWQAFDSWDECYYTGVCYEKECASLQGGWKNLPFARVPAPDQIRNWWVKKGPTPSNRNILTGESSACPDVVTGPCGDHTTGSGKYLYVESSACFDTTFDVFSPVVSYTNTSAKVSFRYFMHGADLQDGASLAVSMSFNASADKWTEIGKISGEQQPNPTDSWGLFEKVVDDLFPQPPSQEAPVEVQFRFRAVTAGSRTDPGDWWKGDMAIDDVVFTQAGASEPDVPYVDPTPTPSPSNNPIPGDDGLDDGIIAAIVAGVVGGLLLLLLLLALLLIILLLIISPRRSANNDVPMHNYETQNDENPVAPRGQNM